MVKIQYKSKGKPILTIADALQANTTYEYPGEGNVLMAGDAKGVYIILCCVVCSCGYLMLTRLGVKYYLNINSNTLKT